MTFKELHHRDRPLLICNVWDVSSSRIAERLGFGAIGTSSAAIAASLGYEDGERIRFNELLDIVKKIINNTDLPLTVDLESGFSKDPYEIARHIKTLSELGVVGVNIEDSVVDEKRVLVKVDDFSNLISIVKQALDRENTDIFLNVRTDTFLLGVPNQIIETKRRIERYSQAGADGIFIPCIKEESDIQMVVEMSALPINVMCMPDLPNFNILRSLGVKRISMGNFLFDNMTSHLQATLRLVLDQQSFQPVFKVC